MLPKTLSENLDMVLKYRSYNIIADPVAFNSIPFDGRWPRSQRLASSTLNYTTGILYFSVYGVDASEPNTYTSLDPIIPVVERPIALLNTINPGTGFFHFDVLVTLNQVRANELYQIALELQGGGLGTRIIACDTLTTAAAGPTDIVLSCAAMRYCNGTNMLAIRMESSDGAGVDAVARINITKIQNGSSEI